jgi:hypothetical protein
VWEVVCESSTFRERLAEAIVESKVKDFCCTCIEGNIIVLLHVKNGKREEVLGRRIEKYHSYGQQSG